MREDYKLKAYLKEEAKDKYSLCGKRKKKETRPSLVSDSYPSVMRSLNTDSFLMPFEQRNIKYVNEGMSQYTQQFLRKMARSKKVSPVFQQFTLLSKLVEIAKILHLNELEISVWSLILDSFGWTQPGIDRDIFLVITAFQSKQYFNNKKEMIVYYSKVSALHPEFPREYKKWMSSEKSTFLFSPLELNKRYNKYRKIGPVKGMKGNAYVDYNESVEELLKMAAHIGSEPVHEFSVQEKGYKEPKCLTPLPDLNPPMESLPKTVPLVNVEVRKGNVQEEDKSTEKEGPELCKTLKENEE